MIWWLFHDDFFFSQTDLHVQEENSSENLFGRIAWTLFFMCLCKLVRKQRRMSRKGTQGYTIPSGSSRTNCRWPEMPLKFSWNVNRKWNKSVCFCWFRVCAIVHGVIDSATSELVPGPGWDDDLFPTNDLSIVHEVAVANRSSTVAKATQVA